jgi:DNA polymerase I-like protein with 3'-5' exonuclease and polymerase domains
VKALTPLPECKWALTSPLLLDPERFWGTFYHPDICLDFETSGAMYGSARLRDNRLVSVSFSCRHEGRFGEIKHARVNELGGADLLQPLYERAVDDRGVWTVLAHNAKFEAQWLQRMGFDTAKILFWDTMLGEYVLAGNRRFPLSLGAVGEKYGFGGKEACVDLMLKAGVPVHTIPAHWLEERNRQDVKTTIGVHAAQMKAYGRAPELVRVLYTRALCIPVYADIEMQGIGLDPDAVQDEIKQERALCAKLEREFAEMTGGRNARSAKQMAEYVYGELGFKELCDRRGRPVRNKASKAFPDGVPKTSDDVLSALVATTGEQKAFIDLKKRLAKSQANLSKALVFFEACCETEGATFYTNINQAVTQTHRTSATGVPVEVRDPATGKTKKHSLQGQNLRREYKRFLRARGFFNGTRKKMFEADGMQIEFRAAAGLANDAQAIVDIGADEDIHRKTAAALAGVPEAQVTKAMRTAAKKDTFGPLYGKRSGTPEQLRYFEYFRNRYADIYKMQTSWTLSVLVDKELTCPWGLKFYWPDTERTSSGYITNTTNIFNYPIQSFATADLIPMSVVHLWHRTRGATEAVTFVNVVHDSVWAECPEEFLEDLRVATLWAFTADTFRYVNDCYEIALRVPLGVGYSAGETLGDKSPLIEGEVNVTPSGLMWRKGE